MDFLLHIVAGAFVGFAIGVTGVGGGSLMTPLLLVFGYSPPVAIGTDLLYAAITKANGVYAHHKRGNVNWKIVYILASGSIPISLGLHAFYLDASFQDSSDFEQLLTKYLGIMLIVTSIILILKDYIRKKSIEEKPAFFMIPLHKHRSIITWLMGILLGFCVTLSSVGAGAFGAAILLTIYSQTSVVKVIGTDIAHAVPLTLIAGLGYLVAGFVDILLLIGLLIGSLPAIHFGSKISSQVPDKLLQHILAVILFSLGVLYSI